jgi:inosose dehydratase
MKITLGTAPDSWGVWFPADRRQTPWQRCLDEIAAAGYEWTELGPYGYLPTDSEVLKAELERRGLRASGTFVLFDFEDAELALARAEEVRRTCAILQFLGAPFLILIDDVYSDLWTGEPRVSPALDEDAWHRLLETTAGIADVAIEHGLRPVLHPHAETHVEYEEQIERFLADCDARIGLCLDVGHHAYRGGDPVAFFRRHHERIPYLHLKSVDPEVQRRVEAEGIPFAKAVAIDVFVEPAKGVPDFLALRDALAEVGYEGFAIVEQDMYPAPFDKPFPIAKRTYEYLRQIGIA